MGKKLYFERGYFWEICYEVILIKRKEKQSTKTEVQRFSIRKYSVGTISVLTATFL
ncbi:YSIRK-type signal peptide-containing protein [Staphylococcus xylosus]|nr:YSIRK-type signal peptide-containing protein [Staphylococcus xylosus]